MSCDACVCVACHISINALSKQNYKVSKHFPLDFPTISNEINFYYIYSEFKITFRRMLIKRHEISATLFFIFSTVYCLDRHVIINVVFSCDLGNQN